MQKLSNVVVVAVFAVAAVGSLAGCPAGDEIEEKNEGEGEEGEGEEGEGEEGEGEEGEGEGEGEDPCDVPADIDDDVVIAAACSPVVVDHDVTVARGGTLTLEAGLTLRFVDDVGLDVRGNLLAEGTADDPIVLESNTGTAAGLWRGVSVYGAPAGEQDDVVLTHVTIQHAGGPSNTGDVFDACLSTGTLGPTVLVVSDSTLADCGDVCFASLTSLGFGGFDDNTLRNCTTGMRVHGNDLADVGVQTLDGVTRNEITDANIARSATWPAQSVSWEIKNSGLDVAGDGAVLTIEAQTIKMKPFFPVSCDNSASLVATDVVFAAASDTFEGVVVGPGCAGVSLTDVSVVDASVGLTVFAGAANVVVSGGDFNGSVHDICLEVAADVDVTGAAGTVEDFAACGL